MDDNTKCRLEKDKKVATDLGCIDVKVYRVIDLGRGRDCEYHGPAAQTPSSFELAEKSLKGKDISHGTM